MNRVRTYKKKVWVDARGREHNIKHMADDHIINCICLMQRQMDELCRAEDNMDDNRVDWMDKQVEDRAEAITMFGREMYRRRKKGITISRDEAECGESSGR